MLLQYIWMGLHVLLLNWKCVIFKIRFFKKCAAISLSKMPCSLCPVALGSLDFQVKGQIVFMHLMLGSRGIFLSSGPLKSTICCNWENTDTLLSLRQWHCCCSNQYTSEEQLKWWLKLIVILQGIWQECLVFRALYNPLHGVFHKLS